MIITSLTALYVPGSDGEPCRRLTHPGSYKIVIIIYAYHDVIEKLMKWMLNPQFLGPLGYSSLGYTSVGTVRSQNEKQEHKIHICFVYILYPSSAQ